MLSATTVGIVFEASIGSEKRIGTLRAAEMAVKRFVSCCGGGVSRGAILRTLTKMSACTAMQTRRRCGMWRRSLILVFVGWFAVYLPHLRGAPNARDSYEKLDLALLIADARPEYPYEARHRRMSGSGVALLDINKATGRVTSVRMDPSTGHKLLDDAAMKAFRKWRFKPGTVSRVQAPVTFHVHGPKETVDAGQATSAARAAHRAIAQL